MRLKRTFYFIKTTTQRGAMNPDEMVTNKLDLQRYRYGLQGTNTIFTNLQYLSKMYSRRLSQRY